MATYEAKIKIDANDSKEVVEVGNLLQFAVVNIDRKDLIKLLTKVKENPGIVKKALMFI